jgi:hypothetical protein
MFKPTLTLVKVTVRELAPAVIEVISGRDGLPLGM